MTSPWVKISAPGEKPYYWNPGEGKTSWALPDGETCSWQSAVSPEGQMYYWNVRTNQTKWDPPSEESPAPKANEDCKLQGYDDDWRRNYVLPQQGWPFVQINNDSNLYLDIPAEVQSDLHDNHAGASCSENWVEVESEGGPYYWNFRVGMSVRRLPQGVHARWSRHHRADDGHPYFYDREKQKTEWEIPGMPSNKKPAELSTASKQWIDAGTAMMVANLNKDRRFNGQVVKILGFQEGQVLAALPDAVGGTVLALRPHNLEPLVKGTIVEFTGLSTATLNGEVGSVDGHTDDMRYLIKMRDGSIKSASGVKLRPRSRLWDIDIRSCWSELQWRQEQVCLFIDQAGHHHKYTVHFPLNLKAKQQDAQHGHDLVPKWPLLVFMHGAGGGSFFTHAKKLMHCDGLQFAASRFVIVTPICDWSWRDVPKPWICELVQHLRVLSFVDHRRVYLTGISMGGMGSWEVGAARPDLFAAMAPVAAYHQATRSDFIACRLQHTPICTVYSTHDERCPVRDEVPLWRKIAAQGNSKLRIQIAPDIDHCSMYERAYCDDKTLFEWLLRFVCAT